MKLSLEPPRNPVSLNRVLTAAGMPAPAADVLVSGITHDNRQVQPGDIFVAIPGFKFHGADFAADAVASGAVAVVTNPDAAPRLADLAVPVVVVDDPRAALGGIAAGIFGNPAAQLLTVGITGTNGKTTTAHMVFAELQACGMKPLLLGTAGIRFGDQHWPSARTTPESSDLQRLLAGALSAGARSLVMEVSSHALVLGRVNGVVFDVAVFTGLSQDHLDFHRDMEDYFQAKASLFTAERAKRAVICVEDDWGRRLLEQCQLPKVSYATGADADWRAVDVRVSAAGHTAYRGLGPQDSEAAVQLSMPGDFNLANSLAALAVARELSLPLDTAAAALDTITVPGRLERVDCGQDFVALVDYAHTPDAVARVLRVARTCTDRKLIAVMGCGGDRDSAKRVPMGAAAASAADILIITDDNPRTEDPAAIRAAIAAGARTGGARLEEIPSRMEAIHRACAMAAPGDCVIILGKGHEIGQEIKGVVTPFDDRVVTAEAIRSVFS